MTCVDLRFSRFTRAIALVAIALGVSACPSNEDSPTFDANSSEAAPPGQEVGSGDGLTPALACSRPTGSESCPAETICERYKCGEPGDFFDSRACLRSECKSDVDCEGGQECLNSALLIGKCIPPSIACIDTCTCGSPAVCSSHSRCVPRSELMGKAICQVQNKDCSELTLSSNILSNALKSTPLSVQMREQLTSCKEVVVSRMKTQACP